MQLQRLAIEYRPVDALAPYAGNARLHSAEQVAKLVASIKRFGFNNPILIDPAGTIVAGHGRLAAARSLGLAEVPVVCLSHVASEAERRAYTLADNRIALDATWDELLLARELVFLKETGAIDLDLTGFGFKEIDRLLKGAHGGAQGRGDANAAPAAAKVAVSQAGDTWLLGGYHRLRCGSSTSANDVAVLLEGELPNLMVTDPPYGVEYDPSWRDGIIDPKTRAPKTISATGTVLNDDNADWRAAWKLFPGNVAYVWHGGLHGGLVELSLQACEFKVRAQIIWRKTRPVLSRGAYHWQHEPAYYAVKPDADDNWQNERFETDHDVALYAVREGETASWHGGRKQSTVWDIEHIKSETGHGTQKPVECMRRPIVNNSRVGDSVYEPFSGSGTTIVAAHIAGRRCFAMELNPLYVDVAVKRWQDFTGKVAILEGQSSEFGGHTFEEVAAARGAQLAA